MIIGGIGGIIFDEHHIQCFVFTKGQRFSNLADRGPGRGEDKNKKK